MTAFLGTKTGASFYRGMQICAVEGVNARAIEFNGRTAGVFYEDEYAEYAVLGGLSPRDRTAGRTEQTLDVFRQMEEALNRAGMDFSHVVRTWFYNNRLLDWYEEFNRARDTFLKAAACLIVWFRPVRGLVPAIGNMRPCRPAYLPFGLRATV